MPMSEGDIIFFVLICHLHGLIDAIAHQQSKENFTPRQQAVHSPLTTKQLTRFTGKEERVKNDPF